jgi:hypothetical protein
MVYSSSTDSMDDKPYSYERSNRLEWLQDPTPTGKLFVNQLEKVELMCRTKQLRCAGSSIWCGSSAYLAATSVLGASLSTLVTDPRCPTPHFALRSFTAIELYQHAISGPRTAPKMANSTLGIPEIWTRLFLGPQPPGWTSSLLSLPLPRP